MTNGKQLIGFEQSAEGTETFKSVNPATGEQGATFHKATAGEVEKTASKAAAARNNDIHWFRHERA